MNSQSDPSIPDKIFKTFYWGEDQSTKVQFQLSALQPPNEQVSACMVIALTDDKKIALSKPERGWGLVGGHREAGETAEECLRREAHEEAAIELGELTLIGHWLTQKVFESEQNWQYPPIAHQLLYVATITKINDFYPQLEVTERTFVKPQTLATLHHDFENFQDIFEHVLTLKELSE